MELLTPHWSVPSHIKAVVTTRIGGYSQGPYAGLNLGDHVGDQPSHVAANRAQLLEQLNLEQSQWLTQVHGTRCIEALPASLHVAPEADACYTSQAQLACVIMTADCLPVLFTDGERVGAAHAGWRGLAEGVLETTLEAFERANTSVWLGPAIGPAAFEVGDEVREQFCQYLPASEQYFVPSANAGKWLADIYGLARLRLVAAGVAQVYGGGLCTFTDAARFFSYRRDRTTGRMATLIWKAAA